MFFLRSSTTLINLNRIEVERHASYAGDKAITTIDNEIECFISCLNIISMEPLQLRATMFYDN